MSKYFKNKISYNHVLLLCIIACYFLILICYYFINKQAPQATHTSTLSYLIEMQPDVSEEQRAEFSEYIDQNKEVIIASDLVSKNEFFKYFDIDNNVSSDLNLTEALTDQYIIEVNDNDAESKEIVMADLNSKYRISDITQIDNTQQEFMPYTSTGLSNLGLSVILVLTLAIFYLGLSLDFNRNRQSLLSIIHKGATKEYLLSTYQKKGFFLSVKAWIGGIVLFFMCFYLLRFNAYMNFSIFDLKFLGIVCLVPLALIIFITSIVIHTKIMTLIRE